MQFMIVSASELAAKDFDYNRNTFVQSFVTHKTLSTVVVMIDV